MKKVLLISILCFIALISDAQTIQRMTSIEFYEQLDSLNYSESFIIIDGRNNRKFNEGHILDAVCVDAFSDDMQTQLIKYINTKVIGVYCTQNTRAEVIIQALKENNYSGIIIDITDGFTGWTENDLPVQK